MTGKKMRENRIGRKKSTGVFLLVGSPEQHADLAYASGFYCPDNVVYLRSRSRRFLLVSKLEYARAVRDASHLEVFHPEMLKIGDAGGGLAAWIEALMHHAGITAADVAENFPLGLAERLHSKGIRLYPRQDPFFPERAIKDAAACRDIAHAQRAAAAAMRRAADLLRRSSIDGHGGLRDADGILTSERVRHAIERELLAHDCLPVDTIVAGGAQSADPHERGHGPLTASRPIVIDIFPQSRRGRHWGDITRTFFKGAPSARLRHMAMTVREAQTAALATLRPGVRADTVHRTVCRIFDARGLPTGIRDGMPFGFIHATGHGVGLEIHEFPRIGLNGKRLRKGHVITVEPGYYVPGLGGIRFEDTVLITETGYHHLASCRVPCFLR